MILLNEIIKEEIDNFRFNFILIEIDMVANAKEFARGVHSGQWRKNSPLPAIVHPMRVYHRVKKMGLSKKHQIVALLHDAFEDSDMPKNTIKKIKEIFGPKIAQLVIFMSHDKAVKYNEYLLSLAKKSPTAFDIKLIDLEDNLSDNPSAKQKEKYKNAIQYVEGNGIKINPKIKTKLYALVGV